MIKTASLAFATLLLAATYAVAQSTDPNATPNSNTGTAGVAQTTDTTTTPNPPPPSNPPQK